MDTFAIIVLSVLELLALVVIVRLWTLRRLHILSRIIWSLILLVPLFGLLMYGFIQSDPEKNPERMESQADSDASGDPGAGRL